MNCFYFHSSWQLYCFSFLLRPCEDRETCCSGSDPLKASAQYFTHVPLMCNCSLLMSLFNPSLNTDYTVTIIESSSSIWYCWMFCSVLFCSELCIVPKCHPILCINSSRFLLGTTLYWWKGCPGWIRSPWLRKERKVEPPILFFLSSVTTTASANNTCTPMGLLMKGIKWQHSGLLSFRQSVSCAAKNANVALGLLSVANNKKWSERSAVGDFHVSFLLCASCLNISLQKTPEKSC